MYCDNDSVYKNISIPESVWKKNHHSVLYHDCREAVASDMIRVTKEDTMENLSDLITKITPKVVHKRLLNMFMYQVLPSQMRFPWVGNT